MVGARMAHRIGGALADHLGEEAGYRRVLRQLALGVDLDAYERERLHHGRKLGGGVGPLCRMQFFRDALDELRDLLERLVVCPVLQIAVKDGEALPNHVVHLGAHDGEGLVARDLVDVGERGAQLDARLLKGVGGLFELVGGTCLLGDVEGDDPAARLPVQLDRAKLEQAGLVRLHL